MSQGSNQILNQTPILVDAVVFDRSKLDKLIVQNLNKLFNQTPRNPSHTPCLPEPAVQVVIRSKDNRL